MRRNAMKTSASEERSGEKPSPLYNPFAIFATMVVLSIILFSYTSETTAYPKFATAAFVLFLPIYGHLLHKKFTVPTEYKLIGAWLLICVLTLVLARDPDLAMSRLLTLGMVYPMSFAIYQLILWQKSPRAVWFGFVLGTLALCYLEHSTGMMANDNYRLTGAGNANMFAYLLVAATIFLMYEFFRVKSLFMRLLLLVPLVIVVRYIPLTGSRQGLIALFIVMLGYAMLKLNFKGVKNGAKSLAVLVLFTTAIGLTFIYAQSSQSYLRLTDVISSVQHGTVTEAGETGQSAKYRYLFYVYGIQIALDHPMGIGVNNFTTVIEEYMGGQLNFSQSTTAAYAHSNYIEVLVDTGFIGFGIYYFVYIVLANKLLQMRALRSRMSHDDVQLYHAAIVLLIVLTMTDFTLVTYYDKSPVIVFASLIAVVQLLWNRRNEIRTPTPKVMPVPSTPISQRIIHAKSKNSPAH